MKLYRVVLGISGTVSCDVEAESKEEAEEIAREEVDNTNMEWRLEDPFNYDSVQEIGECGDEASQPEFPFNNQR